MLREEIHLPDMAAFRKGVSFGKSSWYAVRTMARHEKRVAAQLQEKRVMVFLPLVYELHRWSDREVDVEVPLFSCYLFVRILPTSESRLSVLQTPGVRQFVGNERQGTPIPEQEIESLRTAIAGKATFGLHRFLTAGKRVRIRGGSLDGVEGIVTGEWADRSVVLSVQLLRRSVSIRVEGYDLELV